MSALSDEVLHHWGLYLIGVPVLPDAVFDALVERLRREEPDSVALGHLGSGGDQDHETPMLSLQKVKSEVEIEKWRKAVKAKDLIVMPKFDGLACALRYSGRLVRATTRGDGKKGEDITRHLLRMNVPLDLPFSVEVRGEILLPRRNLSVTGGATCRNAAVGLIGRTDTAQSHLLDFVAWGVVGWESWEAPSGVSRWTLASAQLKEWGFKVPLTQPYSYARACVCINEDGIYDRDGAVIVIDDFDERGRLGANDHHPRWAVALKLPTNTASTKVTGIEWQVGRTGVVTPVLLLDPVDVDGVQVARVTGHNVATLLERDLGVGSLVEVTRRGGVIPHVENVILGVVPDVPVHCATCGDLLHVESRILTHSASCPDARRAALEYLLKTLGVDGFGKTTLRDLDVFSLSELVAAKLPQHLRRSIASCVEVALETALEAVGYPLAGRLAGAFFDWHAVVNATDEELLKIDGLGAGTVAKIRAVDHGPLDMMTKVGISIGYRVKASARGPLEGKVLCFTGELQMARSTAQALAKQRGAEVTSSVTKKTTHLVAAAPSGSSKFLKATAQGVVIWSEADFMEVVGPVDVTKIAVDLTTCRP